MHESLKDKPYLDHSRHVIPFNTVRSTGMGRNGRTHLKVEKLRLLQDMTVSAEEQGCVRDYGSIGLRGR